MVMKLKIFRKYKDKIKTNKHLKQAFTLICWNIFSIPLGIITNIIVTRYLGAEDYGNYLYVQKVFEFVFVLLNFGILRSVNRAILVGETEEKKREIIGTGLVFLVGLYLVMSIVMYIAVLSLPNFEEKGVKTLLLIVIPFCFIVYLNKYYEQVLPANNRIDLLIIQRYVPRIAYFLLALGIYFFLSKKDIRPIAVIFLIYLTTQFLTYLYVLIRLKPSFKQTRQCKEEIKKINKEYGKQVYIGDLLSTALIAMIPLLISKYGDSNAGVGFYALSLTLSTPLSFVPQVMGTSHYSEFVHYKKIPRKLLLTTYGISLGALFCLWIIVAPFVNYFYNPEFHPVIILTFITSVGTVLYGFADFISRYLTSQAAGKQLRNSSIIVGISTFVLSLFLIPWLGETGAAITHALSGIIYIISITVYYKIFIKTKYNSHE